jgi:ankyrin repeat protein
MNLIKSIKKAIYLIVLIGYSFSYAGSYDDFFQAIALDNAAAVQALLNRGFDPNSVNSKGQPALLLAMQLPSPAVAQVLIAHPDTKVEIRTEKDESPLMLGAIKGQLELCRQLIERDADVNKPGWAPLHYAATSGNVEVIQLLLDHYAYIDADSPNGSTPLMMAAMYGSDQAVKLLLDAGADASLKNTVGLTALDFAQKSGHEDSVARIAAAIRAKKPAASW